MIKLIFKILCKVGVHKYYYIKDVAPWVAVSECAYCKKRIEDYAGGP